MAVIVLKKLRNYRHKPTHGRHSSVPISDSPFDRYINLTQEQARNASESNCAGPEGLPILVDIKEHCCGCTACFAACPVGAIVMKADTEGFLYPVVDAGKCIRCHICEKICVFKSDQKNAGYY